MASVEASAATIGWLSTTDMVALVAAGVGAFIGSGSAFLLEAMRRRREESNLRYSAMLQAQVVIWSQLNTMLSLQKLHLDEHRDDPQRYLKLVQLQMSTSDMRVDFQSLWFLPLLADTELIGRLNIAEQGYLTSIEGLVETNRLIEGLNSAAEIVDGHFDFESGIAEVVVDARQAKILKDSVDGLYDCVDASIKAHAAIQAELEKAMKQEWPRRPALHLSGFRDTPANNGIEQNARR